MRPIRLAAVLLFLGWIPGLIPLGLHAAEPGSKAALVEGFQPTRQDPPAAEPEDREFSLAPPAAASSPEPETRKREQAAWRAYYDYKIRGLRHRGEVYDWQLTSGKITFAVVLFLVMAGIYFSWLQFRSSLLPRPPAKAVSTVASAAPDAGEPAQSAVVMAVTEISAGREGIKVSSPVLGVIILVISLLFFYLYLVYIYPISETF